MTTTEPDQRLARLRSDGRRRIQRELAPDDSAVSVNGRDVTFVASFDFDAEVGGFITIDTGDGRHLIAQVTARRLAERQLATFDVDWRKLMPENENVSNATLDLSVQFVEGDAHVVGHLDEGAGRDRGFDEAPIRPASSADVEHLVRSATGRGAALPIGRLTNADAPALLAATGFSRHTFLCGQSGSGKTYAMGVLLEQLLLHTDLPMVIFDPNSDHVALGRLRDAAELARTRGLSRRAYGELKRRYDAAADVAVARAHDPHLPLRIALSDLTLAQQATVLDLDPIADAAQYGAFIDAAESLGDVAYGFDEVVDALRHRLDEASRQVLQRIVNLGITRWSVWAAPGERSLAEVGTAHRVLVLDVGTLADPRERSVIALALLGRLRGRAEKRSALVVIDEAHNVCPPEADTAVGRAVSDLAVWVAGEGRKYGLHLLIATQRPQKVHRNVISQCDNLLLMRVNSATDLVELGSVFSHVPAQMIAEASSFTQGEMLAAGPIAKHPLRLRVDARLSPEGGADLPTDWAVRHD